MAAGRASGVLDIWHIAHPVADLDRSVAFYCDIRLHDPDGLRLDFFQGRAGYDAYLARDR